MRAVLLSINLILVALSVSANATSPASGTEIKFVPQKGFVFKLEALPVAKKDFVQVASEDEAALYPDTLVYVTSTGTYISAVKEEIQAADATEKYKRYEVELQNTQFIKHPMIPISPCHDSTDGFGGSTGYTAQLGIGTAVSLSLNLGTIISDVLTLSLGVGLSNSITASESITCTVNQGDVVQIFVEPWILNTDYRYRSYYSAGTRKKFRKSSWSAYANNDFPLSVSPSPFCVTGVGNVSCSQPPQSSIFLENGAF